MDSDAVLALLRGAHVASLLSLVGAVVFPILFSSVGAAVLQSRLRRVVWASALAGLVFGLLWFFAESQEIAGAQSWAGAVAAMPAVISDMQFGRLLALRLVLLVAALGVLALPGPRDGFVLALGLIALIIQPWLGHPDATAGLIGDVLIGSEILHLLAASVWLGGLVPLLICLAILEPAAVGAVFRRFTWVALAAVIVLAGTATVQGALLAGGVARLAGTPYGRFALVKAALFLAALVLAAVNGLVLTGRLAGPDGWAVRRRLRASLVLESLIGLAVVLVAGRLAGMAPGVEQTPAPVRWPPLAASLSIPVLVAVVAAALLLGSFTMPRTYRNRT